MQLEERTQKQLEERALLVLKMRDQQRLDHQQMEEFGPQVLEQKDQEIYKDQEGGDQERLGKEQVQ